MWKTFFNQNLEVTINSHTQSLHQLQLKHSFKKPETDPDQPGVSACHGGWALLRTHAKILFQF